MSRLKGIAIALVLSGAALVPAGAAVLSASGAGFVAGSYDRDYDRDDRYWDAAPQELDEVARQGFHDGIEGARKDFGNHRRPDVFNRDEYRNPDMPRRYRQAYRAGFERGYRVGVEHYYNWR